MIKRFHIPIINEKAEENFELAQWAWDSHCWVEYSPGYCKCKWCDSHHTSETIITKDYPICQKNEIVNKIQKEQIKTMYIAICKEGS